MIKIEFCGVDLTEITIITGSTPIRTVIFMKYGIQKCDVNIFASVFFFLSSSFNRLPIAYFIHS